MQELGDGCSSLGTLSLPSLFLLGLEVSSHCCSTYTINHSLYSSCGWAVGVGRGHQAEMARAAAVAHEPLKLSHCPSSPATSAFHFREAERCKVQWPLQVTYNTRTSPGTSVLGLHGHPTPSDSSREPRRVSPGEACQAPAPAVLSLAAFLQ